MKKAFTLVEMLVSIIVIWILFWAVVTKIKWAQQRAYDAWVINDIKIIWTALKIKFTDTGRYPLNTLMTDDFDKNWRYPLVPQYLSTIPYDRSKRSFEYGIVEEQNVSGAVLYDTRCDGAVANRNPLYTNVNIRSYRMVWKNVPFSLWWWNTTCTQNMEWYWYVPLPKTYLQKEEWFMLVWWVSSLSTAKWVNKPWHINVFFTTPAYMSRNPRVYFPYPTHQLLDVKNTSDWYQWKIRGSDIPWYWQTTLDWVRKTLCKSIAVNTSYTLNSDSYMILEGNRTDWYNCFGDFKTTLWWSYYYGNQEYTPLYIEVFE